MGEKGGCMLLYRKLAATLDSQRREKETVWYDYIHGSQGICAPKAGVMNGGFEISLSSI